MRLSLNHQTRYRFERPAHDSVHVVRLTPRPDPSQMVTAWSVTTNGALQAWTDGFGNLVHLSVHNGLHEEVVTTVQGDIETYDTHGVLPPDDGLPPLMFLRETPLTKVTAEIQALSEPFAERRDDEGAIAALHALMWRLHEAVGGEAAEAGPLTSAAEALERGAGASRDHAHLFIACCRVLAIPARFVSGYLVGEADGEEICGHAWAEAYVDDLGWVAFDSARAICATDAYVRLAVALDHLGACPLRGIGSDLAGDVVTATVRIAAATSEQTQRQGSRNRQTQQL